MAQEGNPAADERAVVTRGNARFTILTPALIRMEWSPTGTFEDRASFTFVHRKLPPPTFTQRDEDGWLVLATDELTLRYRPDAGQFSPDNLRITFNVSGEPTEWRPGMKPAGNLRGTARTLDGVSGARPLEPGLLSRDGWTVVDDSHALLFGDGPRRWATPRKEREALDWYFFGYGRDYARQLGDFVKVAGRIPLPPRFAFGAWWSRYWAYTADELKTLVSEFDAHDVPLDVLVIDMDWHLDGWTGYTWNPKYFPDPDGFLAWTHEQGLMVTLNLHPHSGVLKHEAAFATFAQAMGVDPKSTEAIAFDCTDSRFMRAYFDILHHPLERQGVDFWWLDWQQGEASKIPGLDPLFWLNHLHWQDMLENPDRAGQRPLNFSRWGGLGNHRYQIGFSGDTFCNWASLAFQPYFTATAGNVGFAYWSHDIGGHQPGPVDPELYTRWVQFGALSPILRSHTTKRADAERRIWEFDKPYFEAMRAAYHLRYELIPYIYTMARKCYDTGLPLCRPLYYAWPELDAAYTHPGEYLFGDDLLVAPVTKPANPMSGCADVDVWLPPGVWFNWFTGKRYEGPMTASLMVPLEQIPLFVRAGAVIPTMAWQKRADAKIADPLVLHVFPGEAGDARVYDDGGVNRDYADAGHAWLPVKWNAAGDTFQFELGPYVGDFGGLPEERTVELRLRDLPALLKDVRVNGRELARLPAGDGEGHGYDIDSYTGFVRVRIRKGESVTLTAVRSEVERMPAERLHGGLRGQLAALQDVGEILGVPFENVPAEFELPTTSFPLDCLSSGVPQVPDYRRILSTMELEPATQRMALMRLLGLTAAVEARASNDDGRTVLLRVRVGYAPVDTELRSGDGAMDASFDLLPRANWQGGDTRLWGGKLLPDHPVTIDATLHSDGDFQTSVLRSRFAIDDGAGLKAELPIETVLLPSINRWHLIGPFDAPEANRLQKTFPPEQGIDLAATYPGKGGAPIGWQKVERVITPDSDLTDEFFVEFHKYFDGIKYDAVAYALAYLHAPAEMDASLAFGSDDGIVIWLNDTEIHREDVGRAYTSKEDRVPIRLQEGPNKLLVKISQGGGMWGFGMHVETADGAPLPEVLVKWTADGDAGS